MRTYLLASIVLTACSSNPLDPGAGNQAGTGTGTLLVNGDAHAHSDVANAKLSTDFTTDINVQIMLNNQQVTTGTVTIKSSKATTTLTYDQNGNWQATAANYDEAYELSVISGADKVTGVIVDGPDIHEFVSPTMGATLDSTIANTLKWDRAAAADQATLRVGDLPHIAISDTGNFSMPAGTLRADTTQARPNTLVLTRENQVVPKGAVAGSSFTVSVDNELDVIAQPTM
jgi:hypothetical protein